MLQLIGHLKIPVGFYTIVGSVAIAVDAVAMIVAVISTSGGSAESSLSGKQAYNRQSPTYNDNTVNTNKGLPSLYGGSQFRPSMVQSTARDS